jgi:hypothetical protein
MPPESTPLDMNADKLSDTRSEKTFKVHRQLVPHVLGAAICLAFISMWVFERFLGIGAEFILSPEFSAFIFLFVTPVALLLVYLIVNRVPVIVIRDSCVHIANATFPWRKTTLAANDILAVEPDWIRDTSHCTMVFYVTPECFAAQRRSGVWSRRKDGKLSLHLMNTDTTPTEAVAQVRHNLRIPTRTSQEPSDSGCEH